MEKLRAIAIDDEKHALNALTFELERNCPEIELIHTFNNTKDALPFLNAEEIDLLFLDIHLQGESGIEFLENIMPVEFEVIFVTAYDEFAIQAFDLAASHYLLKPVSGRKLKLAIDKVKKEHQNKLQKVNWEAMIKDLKQEISKTNKIAVPVLEGIEFLDPETIVFVKADSNYSTFYLDTGRKLTISKTLKDIESELVGNGFLRIHKSNLINITHLTKYVKTDGGFVIMSSGHKLPVSRNKRTLLNELFRS